MGFLDRLFRQGSRETTVERNPQLRALDPGMKSYLLEHPDVLKGRTVDQFGYMRNGKDPRGNEISEIYFADDTSQPICMVVLTRYGYREHKG